MSRSLKKTEKKSKRSKSWKKNILYLILILGVSFLLSLQIQNLFHAQSLIPTIFVLAVFLISLVTQGYIWGIVSSLISMMAVNYAFTFPYFTFTGWQSGLSLRSKVRFSLSMLAISCSSVEQVRLRSLQTTMPPSPQTIWKNKIRLNLSEKILKNTIKLLERHWNLKEGKK